jgi:hypothetical protein
MRSTLIGTSLGALALFLCAQAARADVIDGSWCLEPGRRMSIDGPNIITPAGTRTKGEYSRHYFQYVVPASDPGAGSTITMQLLNEETVRVHEGGADVIWRRCGPSVSALPILRRVT